MRPGLALASALFLLLAPTPAATAEDIPLAGLFVFAAGGDPGERLLHLFAWTGAHALPQADPRQGASLHVHSSNGPGQCHAEIPLPASGWVPIHNRHGRFRGFRYHDPEGAHGGVKRVLLRGGWLKVTAVGNGWPCGLAAQSQTLPFGVELRLADSGGERYCASFGGLVLRNEPGRFAALFAPAPATCLDDDLTVANLNVLHGLVCPAGFCRAEERIDLLGDWIEASGCPDVVTLQEIINLPGLEAASLIEARMAAGSCSAYETVYGLQNFVDDQLVLSRHPVLESEVAALYRNFRNVLFARIDHPIGPVDVLTTHLASGSDGGPGPCGPDCPDACVAAGATTVRECQAVEAARFLEDRHDADAPAVLTGDLNAEPDTFTYQVFSGRGWIDTHLAAGNPECQPTTGVGCTSGRASQTLAELESPASNQDRRIDYTFLVPPGPGSLCTGELDPADDLDGDGSATRIFADDPNPFVPICGPLPAAICWPSDHEGSEMDLNCF